MSVAEVVGHSSEREIRLLDLTLTTFTSHETTDAPTVLPLNRFDRCAIVRPIVEHTMRTSVPMLPFGSLETVQVPTNLATMWYAIFEFDLHCLLTRLIPPRHETMASTSQVRFRLKWGLSILGVGNRRSI